MIQTIDATYEDGVLKPDEPLTLLPHARVRLLVELLEGDEEQKRRDQAWTTLEQLWRQSGFDSRGDRLSRDDLHGRR